MECKPILCYFFFRFRRSVIDMFSMECGRAGSWALTGFEGSVQNGMLEIVNDSESKHCCRLFFSLYVRIFQVFSFDLSESRKLVT